MFNLGNKQGFANQGLENNSQNQFSNDQFQNQEFANQQGFNQNQQTQPLNQTPKGLFQIPERYLQLIPLLPFALEMLTGQKVPPVGVMADILSEVRQVQFQVQQLQASLSQVSTQQQQLWTKLSSLENNASNQLNSLSQQVANTNQNFKMFETKRSLEINRPARISEPNMNEPEPANEYN
jgi:hypothetical protein